MTTAAAAGRKIMMSLGPTHQWHRRGAAKVMAADLAATPPSGLIVQLCRDAHLPNFGRASPERQLLFGLNDVDESRPGPSEDDPKRMAASLTIAARSNDFTPKDTLLSACRRLSHKHV